MSHKTITTDLAVCCSTTKVDYTREKKTEFFGQLLEKIISTMDRTYSKRFDVICQLRGAKGNLVRLMRPGCAYVDIRAVETSLTPEQLNCQELEIITRPVAPNVDAKFIRATFGHKNEVAQRLYTGTYVPYSGPNDIFCLTHFAHFGLGEINSGRQVNMLTTPDITINKGVVGYVSISQARLRGVEFWSKIGDRYGNKVVCFDVELKECFYHFVYVPTYADEESLLRTHAGSISLYSRFMSPLKALAQAKRLIITEEDDDESDIELGVENMDMSTDMDADDELEDEFHIGNSARELFTEEHDEDINTYGDFFSEDGVCESLKKIVIV
jgi:hypothetical protein